MIYVERYTVFVANRCDGEGNMKFKCHYCPCVFETESARALFKTIVGFPKQCFLSVHPLHFPSPHVGALSKP